MYEKISFPLNFVKMYTCRTSKYSIVKCPLKVKTRASYAQDLLYSTTGH